MLSLVPGSDNIHLGIKMLKTFSTAYASCGNFLCKNTQFSSEQSSKRKIHSWQPSSLLIPSGRLNKQEKKPFCSLISPYIQCKNYNKYMTRFRNRMPVLFLTYSRHLIISKKTKIVSAL